MKISQKSAEKSRNQNLDLPVANALNKHLLHGQNLERRLETEEKWCLHSWVKFFAQIDANIT